MFKIKLLTGLAALVAAFAVTAAPASAWFESNSTKTTGRIKTFPETTTFRTVTGGPPLECKRTGGEAPAGEWEILTQSGTPAKAGPNEKLTISKWGHCTGPASLPLKVKCSLLVSQPSKGSTKATGGVQTGCEVVLENGGTNKCTITVSSQTNQGLKAITLAEGLSNEVEISSEVTGITSETVETGEECKKLSIKPGATGEFKTSTPLITEGQKLA
jgi:hypothetical protein